MATPSMKRNPFLTGGATIARDSLNGYTGQSWDPAKPDVGRVVPGSGSAMPMRMTPPGAMVDPGFAGVPRSATAATGDHAFAGAATGGAAPMPTLTSGTDRMNAMKRSGGVSIAPNYTGQLSQPGGGPGGMLPLPTGRARTNNPNARPVGRSMYDPGRMAETAYRRHGDARPLMQLQGQQFHQQQFDAGLMADQAQRLWMADREDARFERGLMMEEERYQRGRADALEDDQRESRQRRGDLKLRDRLDQAADARDRERNQGFTVQPLDPDDPSRGSAVIRGDGTLFNLLPAPAKPQTAPSEVEFLPLPGTQDAIPTIDGRPVPGSGIYTTQPGWSLMGLDQFMPKREQAQESVTYLEDGSVRRTVKGAAGSVPAPKTGAAGETTRRPSSFLNRFTGK